MHTTKSIWLVKKGEPIMTFGGKWDGVTHCSHCKYPCLDVTIETYAKTYHIICTVDTLVKTDHGDKNIMSLAKDDGLFVKGVYVPQKYTAVKKVKIKKLDERDMYYLETRTGEFFANEILIKNDLRYGNRLHIPTKDAI